MKYIILYFFKEEADMSLLGNLCGCIGYIRHMRGDLKGALLQYEKGYKKGMGYRFQLAYGLALLRMEELDRSREVFSQILASPAPEDIRLFAKYNQGMVYWKLGRIDDAHDTMEAVFRKRPDSKSYGALGYFKILKGDLEDALSFNLKALEYDDEDPVVLDNLGMIYDRMGDTDKALGYFLKAEEQKADQVSTLYNLGRIYREKGESDLAREKLEKALACTITPLSAVTRDQIASELARLGG
jgi:tetratricopeptide (TPR) repeat protein